MDFWGRNEGCGRGHVTGEAGLEGEYVELTGGRRRGNVVSGRWSVVSGEWDICSPPGVRGLSRFSLGIMTREGAGGKRKFSFC